MAHLDVVRAWKDADYRLALTAAESEALPVNPAGIIEIDGSDLFLVAGGKEAEPDAPTNRFLTMGCCAGFSVDPSACGLCTMTCWVTCWVTIFAC
jgi:mersacidin/lichenicidin family type 2 lantibiotic